MPFISLDGTRVLVADDQKLVLSLLTRRLQNMGCRTTTAGDGRAALEIFRKNPHNFDLVLTDYDIPELNGGELARCIMAIRPELPVVLVTGKLPELDEDQAYELNKLFCSILIKPFTSSELEESLQYAFRYKTQCGDP